MAQRNPAFCIEEDPQFPVRLETESFHICDDDDTVDQKEENSSEMIYTIGDVPPWYSMIVLGIQHYLTMFGSTLAIPFIVAPALCIGKDYLATSEILSTILFVSGMVTILQALFGVRLPIVQGGSFAFLTPILAIMNLPEWQCPDPLANSTNQTLDDFYGSEEHREIWTSRMREIQGAVIGASCIQVILGATGLIGLCLKFITPLAIAPTITLIGLALFETASGFSSGNWWVAAVTMVLIIIFSQYCRNLDLPICSCKNGGCQCSDKTPFFKLFPIILAMGTAWAICGILTATDTLPEDSDARTDTRIDVLFQARWFRFPYPGQWGTPTFSAAAILGMFGATVASMIESIGDYYACARLSAAPPPPHHAINRGIFLEGVGCILAGLWGTGPGLTSYSANIGAIGITKVGCRSVVVAGGIIMMFLGTFAKFGALFVTIPDPIVGGVLMTMFGMIAAIGVSNLQLVDMNSSRNLFIFGFSLLFGLSMPNWLSDHPEAIQTGNDAADQILFVLLSTSMLIGGVIGAILDNTVPGTPEERGIDKWLALITQNENIRVPEANDDTYDLPLCTDQIKKVKCFKYAPICPTFDGFGNCTCGCCKDKKGDTSSLDDETIVVQSSIENHCAVTKI